MESMSLAVLKALVEKCYSSSIDFNDFNITEFKGSAFGRPYTHIIMLEKEAKEEESKRAYYYAIEDETIELSLGLDPVALEALLEERVVNADNGLIALNNPFFSYDISFKLLEMKIRFMDNFTNQLRDIRETATRLAEVNGVVKDHDLMIVFKGSDDLKELVVDLCKVPYIIPEDNEVGNTRVRAKDWLSFPEAFVDIVKELEQKTKSINVLIVDYLTSQDNVLFSDPNFTGCHLKEPLEDLVTKILEGDVKRALMASSHFIQEIYHFTSNDAMEFVEEVVGEIVSTLNKYKQNIGLDINNWICYEYGVGEEPRVMEEEELNFIKHVRDKYTPSFVTELYSYLLRLNHRAIKPYTYLVKADASDGVKVGDIGLVDK